MCHLLHTYWLRDAVVRAPRCLRESSQRSNESHNTIEQSQVNMQKGGTQWIGMAWLGIM